MLSSVVLLILLGQLATDNHETDVDAECEQVSLLAKEGHHYLFLNGVEIFWDQRLHLSFIMFSTVRCCHRYCCMF